MIRAKPILKQMIIERGIKQKDIAKELEITTECVHRTVNRKTGSLVVAYAIASLLGVKKREIFEEVK